MDVVIATESGEFTLQVGIMETVVEVKEKIQQLLGVSVDRQILSLYNFELIDGFDMEFYNINHGQRIDLSIESVKFLIFINISTRRINFEVDKTDTVGSLKEKIHMHDGTPIKRMVLFFSGVEMEDHFYLREYGIRQHSEIDVVLKPISLPKTDTVNKKLKVIVQTASLFNSVKISLEMNELNTVCELRQLLLEGKFLPVDDYFFIHKQRIMQDKRSLSWHGVKNGDPLYVFNGTVTGGT